MRDRRASCAVSGPCNSTSRCRFGRRDCRCDTAMSFRCDVGSTTTMDVVMLFAAAPRMTRNFEFAFMRRHQRIATPASMARAPAAGVRRDDTGDAPHNLRMLEESRDAARARSYTSEHFGAETRSRMQGAPCRRVDSFAVSSKQRTTFAIGRQRHTAQATAESLGAMQTPCRFRADNLCIAKSSIRLISYTSSPLVAVRTLRCGMIGRRRGLLYRSTTEAIWGRSHSLEQAHGPDQRRRSSRSRCHQRARS